MPILPIKLASRLRHTLPRSVQNPKLTATSHLRHALLQSVKDPKAMENIFYGVIILFLKQHENPDYRFVILPQFSIRWKPDVRSRKDKRMEIGDIWLGHFTKIPPSIKLRVGIESKRMLPIMQNLPPPDTIETHDGVRTAFHMAYMQAMDQAKAAFKNNHQITTPMPFLLFVGPYWTHVEYGPFSEAQLTVRALKRSDTADYFETEELDAAVNAKPRRYKLYLLGTRESYETMESVIASTDAGAQEYLNEALAA